MVFFFTAPDHALVTDMVVANTLVVQAGSTLKRNLQLFPWRNTICGKKTFARRGWRSVRLNGSPRQESVLPDMRNKMSKETKDQLLGRLRRRHAHAGLGHKQQLLNHFLPTHQFQEKRRAGTRQVRVYGPAQTPYARELPAPEVGLAQKQTRRAVHSYFGALRSAESAGRLDFIGCSCGLERVKGIEPSPQPILKPHRFRHSTGCPARNIR
jgi:hypothetical protein